MDKSQELDKFRKEWKRELNIRGGQVNTDSKDKKHSTQHSHSPLEIEESKGRPNTYQSFLLAEDLLKQDNSEIHEKFSNSILKRKRSSSIINSDISSDCLTVKKVKEIESHKHCQKERFLDIFIADLDEINEIPFFDVELPRELALNIFWYLDVVELCRCAQLSKAWRSLSEDEVLWLRLCHRYGYNQDEKSTGNKCWKDIFKERHTRQQNIATNWKTRTGSYRQHCYPGGGVLSAVHSSEAFIVAGYTSGEVKFWNTVDEEECLFQPSCQALEIAEDMETGTKSNYVTCVQVNNKYTVAGYSQGYVDMWSNETGTSPVRSFRSSDTIKQVQFSGSGDQLLAVNSNLVRVEHMSEGRWSQQKMIELPLQVSEAYFVENPSVRCGDYVAIAYEDQLKCYNSLSHDDNVISVHDTIGQHVGTFDVRNSLISYSTHCFMESVAKIEEFDLNSKRHTHRVHAHAGQVVCINSRHSPEYMTVTGGTDRKAMIHDARLNSTVMTFHHLNAVPRQVQMDDWKVVCGLNDGMVCVFEQRMCNKLWEFHNRHPVGYLYFKDHILTTANIPISKFPQMQPHEELDNIKHRRYRGNIQVYNFLGEITTDGILDICLSTYDEPSQYNYNVRLAVPYDNV